MSHFTPHESNRVFGLDIFRAAAIILVVMVHGSFILNNTPMTNFPFFSMLDGVDLFFVLSGFLIGSLLLREINKPEKFGMRSLGEFWKRRWFRTLPLYYLVLAANYYVVSQGIIKEDINQYNYKFLIFTQNFSEPFYNFFWESWSLSVEEWFYIFSPVLLFIFLQFVKAKEAFLITVVIMIVFPLIYRYVNMDPKLDPFWYDVTVRKTVLSRLDSIAFGLLAAWMFYYFESVWTKTKYLSFLTGAGLVVFVLNYKTESVFYRQVIYLSITPLAAMLLLPTMHGIKKGRGIAGKAITHISKISYSMYLINLALVAEVIRDNYPPEGTANRYLTYLLFWAIVIGASTLLYYLVEKPVMQLRDKKWLGGK